MFPDVVMHPWPSYVIRALYEFYIRYDITYTKSGTGDYCDVTVSIRRVHYAIHTRFLPLGDCLKAKNGDCIISQLHIWCTASVGVPMLHSDWPEMWKNYSKLVENKSILRVSNTAFSPVIVTVRAVATDCIVFVVFTRDSRNCYSAS